MSEKGAASGTMPMLGARPFPPFGSATVELPAERQSSVRAARPALASATHAARVAILILLFVACGWFLRDHIPIRPDHGFGYLLGISGGVAMLLLALYPARKNLRFMRGWGKLSRWFRIHMILGVAAPVLILVHCNFRLGAPNSNIALGSMLLVASSGAIGRFIYTRINHGLYGARATLEELHAELDLSAHTLGERLPPASSASLRLAAFTEVAHDRCRTVWSRFFRFVALPLLAKREQRQVLRDLSADLDAEAARSGWDDRTRAANEETLRGLIDAYIAALVKEGQFRTYERLASLWHALHYPLFIMLLLTGVMHVIAVHMY